MARYYGAEHYRRDFGLTQLGVRLLAAISIAEGRSLGFYADALEITSAVASRAMYDLTEKESRRNALELVERKPILDPQTGLQNNRFRGHFLTLKGRKVVRRLVAILAGQLDDHLPLIHE